ncbi:hypothetical protein [Selenomonas sp. AE3005]|uniref:hypothetical protein n=1 Tax=Selenomonas sp. AE3005 TaxID=1485543 RepID=UPI0004845FE5|nr:hypothetical protein [Selenomonas sp. AE3005]
MSAAERILMYGVSAEQHTKIAKLYPLEKGYELSETDELRDLIAVPAKAIVINPNILSEDEKALIFDFYLQVHAPDDSLVMIFTEPITIPAALKHSDVHILDNII